jgi:hypothetical protein
MASQNPREATGQEASTENPQQVVELLSPTKSSRGTLYLNRDRAEQLYSQ